MVGRHDFECCPKPSRGSALQRFVANCKLVSSSKAADEERRVQFDGLEDDVATEQAKRKLLAESAQLSNHDGTAKRVLSVREALPVERVFARGG